MTAQELAGYITAMLAWDLFIDHSYQRELSQAWVDKRVPIFDPRLLGVLDVSDRGEAAGPDRWAVVNGQHRRALAMAARGTTVPVPVKVYEGLTVADEAALMHEIDRSTRKLTAWERWVARRVAGDPLVLELEALVAQHGLRISTAGTAGTTAATGALERLRQLHGAGMVDAVLGVLRSAWADDPAAFTAPFLRAVAVLVVTYGDRLDLARLTDVLGRSRPWDVRSTAHAYKVNRLHDGPLPYLIAVAVVDRYNRAAPRGGRLRAL